MTITKELKEDIKEFSVVLGLSVSLLLLSLVLVIFIMKNYVDVNSILVGNFKGKQIYLFLPPEDLKKVRELGIEKNYKDNIAYIKKVLPSYKIKEITTLDNIDPRYPLLVIDNFVLTDVQKTELKQYVAEGGRIIFNFNVSSDFREDLTGLITQGYIRKDKTHTFFLVSSLMSPIQIENAKRLDIVLYDSIPLLEGKKPYLQWSNWAMNKGLYDDEGNPLANGALWSGRYKKGLWIYFSFPLYAFRAVDSQKDYYNKLFKDMVDYAYYNFKVVKYPYLDNDKMIFISEDTEYRFSNLNNFANSMKKLDVNATAFCVGKLAEQNKTLMLKVGSMPNIEIASHSYSHTDLLKASPKKLNIEIKLNRILLHNLSHQMIVGFRPPREQTNENLREALRRSGFKYVLEKNIGQLDVKMDQDLMIIPRLGTDDYAYLVKLAWNKDKIIKNAIKEMKFITGLNAIYTLSTHTHLLSYGSNIKILETIVKEFKKQNIPILKGKDINQKIIESKNIVLKSFSTIDNIVVHVTNNNNKVIKNFTFRVYTKDVKKVSTDFLNIDAYIYKKTNEYIDIRIKKLPVYADLTVFLKFK